MLAAVAVAAACILVSVTYRIYDPDLWENLTVGKAIWQMHAVPKTQLWTWPTYGAPDIKWTWGFSALLWPVWERGGVAGLFAWRWVTTLAAFGLLWAAARRMGARGFVPLVVMVLCSLVWRLRSQVRPETLVAVLLALEIWILETRRHGGKDHAPWLVAVAAVWANVHNSYFIGFALVGIHVAGAWLQGLRRAARPPHAAPPPARLAWVAAGMLAVSFVNPYGWRLVWQPFDFFLHHRQDLIFRSIGELERVDLRTFWQIGLPLLVVGWPVLLVVRWRRAGLDVAEAICCAAFTALAMSTQRFVGFYALVAAPYVSRGLAELAPGPGWLARVPGAARAALVSLACVAVGLPEWTDRSTPFGVGFLWKFYPVAACDFIAAHGVRGRAVNTFDLGGYMLHRFWPDRTRLPFMDIHQAGTAADRELYVLAQQDREAWLELDRRHRFDYVLRGRSEFLNDRLLDLLDADTTWVPVFLDDAAVVYARRTGPLAGIAREFGYREIPAGAARLGPLGAACARDTALRARVVAELEREVAGSPWHAQALIQLSGFARFAGRPADARSLLERALALDPLQRGVHLRLATIALREGRPRDALREVEQERAVAGASAGLDVLAGRAWQRLGDSGRARAAYRAALRREPENAPARDLLDSLERGGAP